MGCNPSRGCACPTGYGQCPFPSPGVMHDLDIIQRWTSNGVLMVITLIVLGLHEWGMRLAFDRYLAIICVLIVIGSANAFHVGIAGAAVRPRLAAWIANVLRFTINAGNRQEHETIMSTYLRPAQSRLAPLGLLN